MDWLAKNDDVLLGEEKKKKKIYQAAIGSLIYLMLRHSPGSRAAERRWLEALVEGLALMKTDAHDTTHWPEHHVQLSGPYIISPFAEKICLTRFHQSGFR